MSSVIVMSRSARRGVTFLLLLSSILIPGIVCPGFGQTANAAQRKTADNQLQSGNYHQAVRLYEAYIKDHPNDPAAYEGLAQALEKTGRSREAAVAYEKQAALLENQAAAAMKGAEMQSGRTAPAGGTSAALPHATAQPPATAQPRATAQTRAATQNANAVTAPARTSSGTGSGRLDGLFLMTRYWVGSGLEIATYYFHSGVVVLNPVAGGANLNIEAERALHPKAVGTYQLSGGQLNITFPDRNSTAKFEDDKKGCFGWDAGVFCPVEIFKPGTTLNGDFTGGASAGGGAVISSTTITFRPDGTYQREMAGSFTSQGRTTSVSGGSVGQERGRYRIDGTALHMMPDGQKEYTVTTFPYDDGTAGPAPRKVYFGGSMLSRK